MDRRNNKYHVSVFDPFNEGFRSYEELTGSSLPTDFSPIKSERDQIVYPEVGTDVNRPNASCLILDKELVIFFRQEVVLELTQD